MITLIRVGVLSVLLSWIGGDISEIMSPNMNENEEECMCDVGRDRTALIALYNATGGDNWRRRNNWLSDRPLNEWSNITTNPQGCVTILRLGSNLLNGNIPPELGDLIQLGTLVLSDNELTGNIPLELTNLRGLEQLWLNDNNLSGSILPELGNLQNLDRLSLAENQFTGTIPEELGNLQSLELLLLFNNNLSGVIPPEIGNLSDLEVLRLDENQLTGGIPRELSRLQNLKQLALSKNSLESSIPNEFGNLENLESLALNDNFLTGEIPIELGQLQNLYWLQLFSNMLDGTIPSQLGRLESLLNIDLSNNLLEGNIPSELGQLPNLRWLILHSNKLNGVIPSELASASNLEVIWLSNNLLTGGIPRELGELQFLGTLDLDNNLLVGNIPSELGQLSSLVRLRLNNNELSGCFLEDMSNLCDINFSDNQIGQGYNFTNNPQLPWQGDFQRFCNGEDQIGALCDDGDDNTNFDEIQADCTCAGTPIITSNCTTITEQLLSPSGELSEGDRVTLQARGENLIVGDSVIWYYSTDPNFEPPMEGTQLGGVIIDDHCPNFTFEGLFRDPCGGNDPANEFIVMKNRREFSVSEMDVNFDTALTNGTGNANIGSGCSFASPTTTLINSLQSNTTCANLNIFAANPSTIIPVDAIVIVFLSNAATADFGLDGLCDDTNSVYVLQNSCTRSRDALDQGNIISGTSNRVEVSIDYSDGDTYRCNNSSSYESTIAQGRLTYFDAFRNRQSIEDCTPRLDLLAFPDIENEIEEFDFRIDDTFNGTYYVKGVFVPEQNCEPSVIVDPMSFTVGCLPINAPTSTGNVEICEGSDIPLLSVSVAGINTDSEIRWYDSPTGGTQVGIGVRFIPSSAGSYYAEVYDTATNCTSSRTEVTLIVNELPIVDIIGDSIVCPDEMTILTASGGTNFQWNNGEMTRDVQVGIGSYDVTVTDLNGCDNTTSKTVTESPLPSLILTEGLIECSEDRTSYGFSFTTELGNIVTTNIGTISGSNGNFMVNDIPIGQNIAVTVENIEECSMTQTFPIPDCSCPPISAPQSNGNIIICEGDNIPALSVNNIGIDANSEIRWYMDETGGVEIGVGLSFIPLSAGNYYAEIYNRVTNCASPRTQLTLTINELPIVDISGASLVCFGETTELTATIATDIGSSFSWSANTGNANTRTVSVGAGLYTVTATDSNGCSSAFTQVVEPYPFREIRDSIITCNPAAVGFDTIPFNDPITGCDTLLQIIEYQLGGLIPPTNIEIVTCDAMLDGTVSVDTFNVTSGCDSIVISTFNYTPPQEIRNPMVTCNPNEVGIDSMFFTNTLTGCDTLLLIIETTYAAPIEVEEMSFTCEASAVGMSIDTIQNLVGCDSLIVMRSIALYPELIAANAGEDIAVCIDDYIELAANQPINTTGRWSPAINLLEDANDPNTAFTNTSSSARYQLAWVLSSTNCADYSSDTVSVAIALSPTAIDDQFEIPYPLQLEADLTENDFITESSWTVRITKVPNYGTVSLLDSNGSIRYRPVQYINDIYFEYELCSDACPQACDEGRVDILFNFNRDELSNDGFTPNDDGKNDTFVIPELKENPDRFPGNEVVVFNRWGDIVYQQDDYQNDWRGNHIRTRKPLPASTYYYIVRLKLADRLIRYGQVTIIR